MSKLLAIEVSASADYSASRKLTAEFIEQWNTAHPGGQVIPRDLTKTDLPFIGMPWILGAFTPPEQHSEESKAALAVGDALIAELFSADHIVIGTPMYNFSIPAILKAYIDHIVRIGVTFSSGFEGMVSGKKATIILASGSDFTPGSPFEPFNAASTYLRQILGFIGITDVKVILAGSTLAIMRGETTMEQLTGKLAGQIAAAAA
ncbi:FMN-dependent NADH-azoreductase [Janthinobacterium agaricidamnosum]|uniref:FMN dependent NADH:quinone oxidoreductase n=1 Tax=Janthinobacterium agaricidamnosum NBRC 102515 = DSM 9628 TaxID=1349767 RepID=W0V1A6_9BURK|nr:NAD(P)H-dependent oxidoreductase [Janthinobacterium agaricidamnosum]CDG81400.1 FMN-dependent NADH-azoreductase 1 [Janthinobacterium agaricidamnosum NBRC 102515 = DSM 9628]